MTKALMGMVGLLLWLVTQAMGLLMAGAGHGWGGAFLFSLPLAVLYPLALIRSVSSDSRSPNADIALFAAAIVFDLLLLGSIFPSGDTYFMKTWRADPTFVAIWLALWAGWQVVWLASLSWRLLRRARAQDT